MCDAFVVQSPNEVVVIDQIGHIPGAEDGGDHVLAQKVGSVAIGALSPFGSLARNFAEADCHLGRSQVCLLYTSRCV